MDILNEHQRFPPGGDRKVLLSNGRCLFRGAEIVNGFSIGIYSFDLSVHAEFLYRLLKGSEFCVKRSIEDHRKPVYHYFFDLIQKGSGNLFFIGRGDQQIAVIFCEYSKSADLKTEEASVHFFWSVTAFGADFYLACCLAVVSFLGDLDLNRISVFNLPGAGNMVAALVKKGLRAQYLSGPDYGKDFVIFCFE